MRTEEEIKGMLKEAEIQSVEEPDCNDSNINLGNQPAGAFDDLEDTN